MVGRSSIFASGPLNVFEGLTRPRGFVADAQVSGASALHLQYDIHNKYDIHDKYDNCDKYDN